ncbi:MAG: hypothetical protein F4Y08_10450 [Caldilineaceae bacterium SB0662_bin_9]|uniref:Uncharacterized protein n=1 Tax=Caldilineaceae bacterium SB0662_bin_9 TaxID=2605258 RepID=A0A6B1DUL6_9CHLR|nr:hypothetical protein [Caldilineaceae bacterium SB0662_bin_9]
MMLQRNQIQIWIAESPELFRWRDVLMRSIGTDIPVMLVFSLLVAAPIWMARRWWFERLAQQRSHSPAPNMPLPLALPQQNQPRRDLGKPFGRQPHPAGTGAADPYRSLLLSRPCLLAASVLWLLLSAAVLLLNSQYKHSALRLEHGGFVLTRVYPVSNETLFFDPDTRKIRIVNGEGSVTGRLTSAESDTTALEPVTDWSFTRRNDQEYFYKEFLLTGLTPGDYRFGVRTNRGLGLVRMDSQLNFVQSPAQCGTPRGQSNSMRFCLALRQPNAGVREQLRLWVHLPHSTGTQYYLR